MTTPIQLHDGRVFPSITDAAAALGVERITLTRHLDRYGHTALVRVPKKALLAALFNQPEVTVTQLAEMIRNGECK